MGGTYWFEMVTYSIGMSSTAIICNSTDQNFKSGIVLSIRISDINKEIGFVTVKEICGSS